MKMNFLCLSVLLGVIISARAADEAKCIVASGEGAFSYDKYAANGPLYWGDLPGFELCFDGMSQSPIDFPVDVNMSDISKAPRPYMKKAKMKLKAKSSNWALDCVVAKDCGYTMFRGDAYYTSNIHFHTPSEHLLNGKQYAIESHIVQTSESGNNIVIATMFDYVDDSTYMAHVYDKKPRQNGVSKFLYILWKQMFESHDEGHGKGDAKGYSYNEEEEDDKEEEKEKDEEEHDKYIMVPFGGIVDRSAGMCVYNGSLTTPPCTQNVHFLMQLKVQPISKVQQHMYYQSVNSPIEGNNRKVQPLNGRPITCYV